MACSEALHGVIYTPEEVGATVDEAGDVVDVTPARAPVAEPAAPPAAHRWTDAERTRFCAQLGDWGLAYDDVAAFCEANGLDRPSGMTAPWRAKILERLQTAEGADKFRAWMSERAQPAGDPPADLADLDGPAFHDAPPEA